MPVLEKEKLKPMMRVSDMVENLKRKNIKFEKMNEKEAEKYLRYNNSYYSLTSYKNNFEKYYINGEFVDKYVNLDFAYLIDLSIIDYRLRLILFNMIITIEHYLKMKILNLIENIKEEDGYNIVNMYLTKDYYDKKSPKKLHNSIFKKIGNSNYQEIFSEYDLNKDQKLENIPIWVFLEIITFGELIRFYEFFSEEYDLKEEKQNIYILREIVKLRNAIAHNTYILTDLGKNDNHNPPNQKIVKYLQKCNVNQKQKRKRLNNSRTRQITYSLYMFNEIVTSDGIKKFMSKEINKLFYNRISLHKEYYNNDLFKSVYTYFDKIIQNNYPKNFKK